MKISYAITVSSEIEEFTRLMDFLISLIDTNDEIVVLVDESKGYYEDIEVYEDSRVSYHYDHFNSDFAAWKNQLNSYCTGDFIFQLDADEMPSKDLIVNLHQILESGIECIAVPRTNIVDGITPEDIARWHWRETEYGINWPDYQWRIYQNIPRIKWEGRVHESPVGFKTYALIPDNQTTYKLDHHKNIEKQRKQNAYYETIQR